MFMLLVLLRSMMDSHLASAEDHPDIAPAATCVLRAFSPAAAG